MPAFHIFLRPALAALAGGQPLLAREALEDVVASRGLTAGQVAQTIASGQGRVHNRVLWALSYLFATGAVTRPQLSALPTP